MSEQVPVNQADRDAVQAFHSIQIGRIMRGDKTLGDDAGDAGVLVQAFARHRLLAEEIARVSAAMQGERPPADASTVEFVRYWMMSSDEPESAWEREFAASIDARHRLAHQPASDVREGFLSHLRRINTDRYHAWVGDGQDAGILFDAAELGGEVGELLNVVKKLEREERGWRGSRAAPEDFADECADVLICLDKLARRRGVDLEAATIAKFNATSDKVGLPHRLTALRALSQEQKS